MKVLTYLLLVLSADPLFAEVSLGSRLIDGVVQGVDSDGNIILRDNLGNTIQIRNRALSIKPSVLAAAIGNRQISCSVLGLGDPVYGYRNNRVYGATCYLTLSLSDLLNDQPELPHSFLR